MGLPATFNLMGWGGSKLPRSSNKGMVDAKNVPLHLMNTFESYSVIFLLRSILRSPENIKGQIPQNVIFL